MTNLFEGAAEILSENQIVIEVDIAVMVANNLPVVIRSAVPDIQ